MPADARRMCRSLARLTAATAAAASAAQVFMAAASEANDASCKPNESTWIGADDAVIEADSTAASDFTQDEDASPTKLVPAISKCCEDTSLASLCEAMFCEFNIPVLSLASPSLKRSNVARTTSADGGLAFSATWCHRDNPTVCLVGGERGRLCDGTDHVPTFCRDSLVRC